MTIDAKTERILREMCLNGPVEYADMVSILERYQPSIEPVDFAAYVQRERMTCGSNEEAAKRAVRTLAKEAANRVRLAEQAKGRPDEQQIRKAFGL